MKLFGLDIKDQYGNALNVANINSTIIYTTPMKVYRIKHKPSGLYFNKHSHCMTEDGSVFEKKLFAEKYLEKVSCGYFSYYGENDSLEADFRKENNNFELKEYDLVD